MKKQTLIIIITGVVIGAMAVLLSFFGNPGNMGFCIACFLRDIAGALKLHGADKVRYVRPEIIGLVLGSCIAALCAREFKPRGGSSPLIRFVLGAFVMVGALMFLGCPLRMVIRLGGGDLNALAGLAGFALGIGAGAIFLSRGFSLGRAYPQLRAEGAVFPLLMLALMAGALIFPQLFASSTEGPGSMRAFWLIALGAGLIVGALCQRSRLCMAGGIRDALLFRDFKLLFGFLAILVTVIIGNLILNKFKLSFAGQSVAHSDWLWNLLGMLLVGWGSALLGGCPLRQLILAGEGGSDSAITVFGMIFGAALCHNLGLASSGEGPTKNGMTAVIIGLIVTLVISLANTKRRAN